jgi:tryptophanyl-tRNA synthetase
MQAADRTTTALTGIKPTGRPHLGNYLGMIRPALDLAQRHRAVYFIADDHALTTIAEPRRLETLIYDVAATWLALGLDPNQAIFYRQSSIPQIFELAWILSCVTAKGALNRAHAYKAALAANTAGGRDPDADISAGLFYYPVLMAADILTFDTDIVPVGRDQRQHVEIARDIAVAFNRRFGSVLKLPEALIRKEGWAVPGIDGRKMSKTYGNTIPVLAAPEELKAAVMRIVTDSKRPEEPKDPERCNLFAIYRHFALPERVEELRTLYHNGGAAYREIKEELVLLLDRHFAPARERYNEWIADRRRIDVVLDAGAARARPVAARTLDKVRRAVGIDSSASPLI